MKSNKSKRLILTSFLVVTLLMFFKYASLHNLKECINFALYS